MRTIAALQYRDAGSCAAQGDPPVKEHIAAFSDGEGPGREKDRLSKGHLLTAF
jgi:hypothetical protein